MACCSDWKSVDKTPKYIKDKSGNKIFCANNTALPNMPREQAFRLCGRRPTDPTPKGVETKPGTPKTASPPAVTYNKDAYVDVTKASIAQLHATCTNHIVASTGTFVKGFKNKAKPDDVFLKRKLCLEKEGSCPATKDKQCNKCVKGEEVAQVELANRITCVDEGYPKAHRQAFSPNMGSTYFPPWIAANATDSDHVVSLSCGGPELKLQPWRFNQLGMLGVARFTVMRTSNTCCPPPNHLKGVTMDAVPGDWKSNYQKVGTANTKTFMLTGTDPEGKGNGREVFPAWMYAAAHSLCDDKKGKKCECRGKWAKCWGGAAYETGSMIGPYGDNQDFPSINAWNKMCVAEQAACYRSQFGETQHCKSEFKFKLLRCGKTEASGKFIPGCTVADGCKVDPETKKATLLIVDTTHRLVTNSPGCKPWFASADAGIRILTADLRAKGGRDL